MLWHTALWHSHLNSFFSTFLKSIFVCPASKNKGAISSVVGMGQNCEVDLGTDKAFRKHRDKKVPDLLLLSVVTHIAAAVQLEEQSRKAHRKEQNIMPLILY